MTGLYHKLHGSHRPVAMKKSTIKRRKRVVPAYPDVAPPSGSPIVHRALSASPDTPSVPTSRIPERPHTSESTPEQQPPSRQPPTIDFTGYNPNQYSPPVPAQSQPSKKRSLSTANEETNDRHQQSNTESRTTNQPIDDIQLDPALAHIGRPSIDQDATTDRESYKAEKRAQLMREAENIRQMLAAKERELAELR